MIEAFFRVIVLVRDTGEHGRALLRARHRHRSLRGRPLPEADGHRFDAAQSD